MIRERRWTRLALATLGAVFLGASIVVMPSVIAFVAPTLLGVAIVVLSVKALIRPHEDEATSRRVLRWALIGFGSHLAFGLVVTLLPTPLSFLQSDSGTYHANAIRLIRHWTEGGILPRLPSGKEGFYYTLAWLYSAFGAYAVVGLVFNATAFGVTVPLLTDSTRRLFGETAARYVPPLVVLMPAMFLWTSQLLKEAGVVLLIVIAANCALRLVERLNPVPLIVMTAAISVLFTYRGPIALIVAAALVGGIASARPAVVSGIGVAAGAGALLIAAIFTVGVGLSGYRAATNTDLAQAQAVRQELATSANSGFDVGADISTPVRAASYLPIGIVNFTFGPFPWQIRNAAQLAALPDVLVWWALLPSLTRGIRSGFRTTGRRGLVLLLPAFLASMVLALAVGNFGALVRERVQVVSLVVPFMALGLAERSARRSTPVELHNAHASPRSTPPSPAVPSSLSA